MSTFINRWDSWSVPPCTKLHSITLENSSEFLLQTKALVDYLAFVGDHVSLQQHIDVILEGLSKTMNLLLKVSLDLFLLRKLKLFLHTSHVFKSAARSLFLIPFLLIWLKQQYPIMLHKMIKKLLVQWHQCSNPRWKSSSHY